jgi:hypothetical protein
MTQAVQFSWARYGAMWKQVLALGCLIGLGWLLWYACDGWEPPSDPMTTSTYGSWADRARNQRLYPLVSLADRLTAHRNPLSAPPNPMAQIQLSRLESELSAIFTAERGGRAALFRRIHDRSFEQFVRASGNGITRVTNPFRSHKNLDNHFYTQNLPPIPQPELMARPERPIRVRHNQSFPDLLRSSIASFAHEDTFGYVVNRERVSGFQPHRFNELPSLEQWSIQRIELLSLLLHGEPAVYVSDHLPTMDAGRTHPRRALTDFESSALQSLTAGEEVVVNEQAGTATRMVGAIRSTKQ